MSTTGKRKADDAEGNDDERPSQVTKTGEGGDVSKDLATLEAEAQKAKELAAAAKKKAAAGRREQRKKDRAAGIEPKRTRRKKDQAEPDYTELAIKKAKENRDKNKDTAKGSRAANSCIRCAARKAKCSDGPEACTPCQLDNVPCLMIDKASCEIYERGELTRLRKDNKRLRNQRDAYRRIHGDLQNLGRQTPLPGNHTLESDNPGQSNPAGSRTGTGGINTPGSVQDDGLSSQTQAWRQSAQGHDIQQEVPPYQQSQQLGQYPYTQTPQNPYQSYAPQHVYQQPGPYPSEQLPFPPQPPYPEPQPYQRQQPLNSLQKPYYGEYTAPIAPAAPGTIAPRDTQVYDGVDLYGDGSQAGAQYNLGDGTDFSAPSQNLDFGTPENTRLAALLSSATVKHGASSNNHIDPQLLDKELGMDNIKTRRRQ